LNIKSIMTTRPRNYLRLSALFCSFYTLTATAQSPAIDTSIRAAAVNNAIHVYHQLVKHSTAIYNGREYLEYYHTIHTGHPFFATVQFGKGSVMYDNILYEDVFLKYDLVKNEVLIKEPTGIFSLILFNDKIGYFTLHGETFVRIVDTGTENTLATGLYQLLYNGTHATLLKKEKKTIQSNVSQLEGVRNYIESSIDYYIQTGDGYHSVNTQREILNVLKDKKNELQAYIRKNKLKFRKTSTEASLLSTVTYYNSLKK
jgi:hypothetical protein